MIFIFTYPAVFFQKTTKKKNDYLFVIALYLILSGQQDSNLRPPRPERGALPTALYPELRCKITLLSLNCKYNIVEFEKIDFMTLPHLLYSIENSSQAFL